MSTTAPDRSPTRDVDPQPDRLRAGGWTRLRDAPGLVRALALVTLVANGTIVVTGAAVRLTSSGLGCPTWPRCTAESFVTTAEYGVHGLIEFGNRLLATGLAVAVGLPILVIAAQRPRRRALVWLAAFQFVGFLGQGVLGGVTVLTGLNPWVVAGHFLVSTVLIYAAYALWHRAGEGDGAPEVVVTPAVRWLVRAVLAAAAVAIVLGTVVTGSGPHAGDSAAVRTGFDPAAVSRLHSGAALLLIGLTVATLLALRATDAPRTVRRAALVLLGVELGQGAIGYVQYFTGLPVLLVGAHVLGAVLLWVAACRLLFLTRVRRHDAAAPGRITPRA
ncbi:MAG TPA: COX15/CtaA family protein [Cryptosporangiaceae bacterium]|nr:COX15/CtaA family protein [Cryptosporangiaceae bacterium]